MSMIINNKKILGTEQSVNPGDLGLFAGPDDNFYVKKSDGTSYALGLLNLNQVLEIGNTFSGDIEAVGTQSRVVRYLNGTQYFLGLGEMPLVGEAIALHRIEEGRINILGIAPENNLFGTTNSTNIFACIGENEANLVTIESDISVHFFNGDKNGLNFNTYLVMGDTENLTGSPTPSIILSSVTSDMSDNVLDSKSIYLTPESINFSFEYSSTASYILNMDKTTVEVGPYISLKNNDGNYYLKSNKITESVGFAVVPSDGSYSVSFPEVDYNTAIFCFPQEYTSGLIRMSKDYGVGFTIYFIGDLTIATISVAYRVIN